MIKEQQIRLTQYATKGGCAAKWGPEDLREVLRATLPQVPSEILLGFETSDDAAVYLLREDLAAVLTIDFLTPLVDDPYEFGRIAATNALSDVFAMGAKPLVALNVLALSLDLGVDVAQATLEGGTSAATEAGAFIVGGHTIDDEEPKYGLSVFGTVHPEEVVRNKGALPGDVLFLTKPLGTGIMTAAHRVGLEDDAGIREAVESMMTLNNHAAQAMLDSGVHAATDITGFGLAGHLHEMLEASGCAALLQWGALPLFERTWEHACAYCRPARSFTLADYAEGFVEQGLLSDEEFDNRMGILCDPQTSGGLLIALPAEEADHFEQRFEELSGKKAACIGEVIQGAPGTIQMD